MNLTEAQAAGQEYTAMFEPYCWECKVAGSTRRQKKTDIKDLELVLLPKGQYLARIWDIINNKNWYLELGHAGGKQVKVTTDKGITLDIFFATEKNFGLIFFIRTGSQEFSAEYIGKRLPAAGYRCEGGYLWKETASGRVRFPVRHEEQIFILLNEPFKSPNER